MSKKCGADGVQESFSEGYRLTEFLNKIQNRVNNYVAAIKTFSKTRWENSDVLYRLMHGVVIYQDIKKELLSLEDRYDEHVLRELGIFLKFGVAMRDLNDAHKSLCYNMDRRLLLNGRY